MKFFQQQRALGFARASLIIGICILLSYVPAFYLFAWALAIQLHVLPWILLIGFPLAALAGLVLGVIGLIGSIRKASHSTKGIVFASIGIALGAAEAVFTALILLFAILPMDAGRPL